MSTSNRPLRPGTISTRPTQNLVSIIINMSAKFYRYIIWHFSHSVMTDHGCSMACPIRYWIFAVFVSPFLCSLLCVGATLCLVLNPSAHRS
jgi:hypothetical protein